MRIFPYLFFVILLSSVQFFSYGQEKKDSILYYLKEAKDTLRHPYLQRATVLSKEIGHDSLLQVASMGYGLESYFKKDTLGIKIACHNLRYLFNKYKDSLILAKEYHYKALKYRRQFRLDSSYYYYNLSKDTYLLMKDYTQVARRLLSMAYMQNDEKDYAGAQNTIIEALTYFEPLKKVVYIGDSYNTLGTILTNQKKYSEARVYYNKVNSTFDTIDSESTKLEWNLHVLNNIGNTYRLEKNYNKALIYLKEGLNKITDKEKYKSQYESLLGNYSECLYETGRKQEAWKGLNELMLFREKNQNEFGLSLSHNGYAHYYLIEGKKTKALYHAQKSLEIAQRINNNSTVQSALKKLVQLTNGNESKKYFQIYHHLTDSLYQREFQNKEQFALIRYETEKIDKENAGLKLENTQQAAQIEREEQQKIIGWLFSLAALLALGFSFSIFRARRKKLMYEAQLQKASAREEERQQIAKTLHDEVAGDLRMLHQKLSKTELQGEAKSVEKIKDNVRNLSHQLSSVSFDEVSFKDQIINLITDNFDLGFRIKTEGIDTIAWEQVNSTIKRTLYLSIRESMQNTIKYAQANKFFIQFSSEKKEILLLLKDNGKGFEKGKGKKGIGLKNLKERVEEIQGTFEINSSEQGTQTTITIPINGR